jgi:nucleoside-diphosphate kinase
MMMMSLERTFIAIKPDAVQRGLIGQIIGRFETKGLKLVALKLLKVTEALAEQHYGEHKGKPFYEPLVAFITSGPVVAMVWEGRDAVAVCRQLNGATDPEKATPGTIRFDFGQIAQRNIVHGSDSVESAEREIHLFFDDDEVLDHWDRTVDPWILPL